MPVNLSAVVMGAALGALLRWALSHWFAHTFSWFAFGMLAANWIGAYIIGIIAALSELFPSIDPHWRLLLITGFLGSLTTFSGFSLEVVNMLNSQRWGAAIAVSSLHLFGSLILTALGMMTVHLFRNLF
ncbi:fluoride efflux transporter CrcB [Neisseria zoodegmatis]|uniref:Fluoride-specific ion channel FluC n=1 Tax=Neisseria zoodegmatis TaxID=326523 RepID=A0AB38DQS9_9NEIS|nr:fluoride efflux transporter CrcB [Neisseria zoodegmatis]OSI09740.1 fluoride ion transporter CrcB [Neisseria zoodegmatis]SNU79476.1 putative CrcB-like protein [Neisseria zoodegmatis]